MNIQRPYKGRAILNEDINKLEIIIASQKNLFIVVFLCFWLCCWAMGEFFAIRSLINFPASTLIGARIFMLVWLCGWTFGGFFVFKTLLWKLSGKEIVEFNRHTIIITRSSYLFSKQKIYDLNEVRKIRAKESLNAFGMNFPYKSFQDWGLAFNGTINFDYGLQTVKFAGLISEVEANHILDKLKVKGILTVVHF